VAAWSGAGLTRYSTSLTDGFDDNLCSKLMPKSCTVYYRKDFWGSWKCEENCDCEEDEFAEKMNDLCVSLGDCGSSVNYIGEGTNNIVIRGKKGKELDSDGEEIDDSESQCKGLTYDKGVFKEDCASRDTPKVSWTNYKNYANPKEDQHVEPQSMDEFLTQLGGSADDYGLEYSTAYAIVGTISGGLGAAWGLNQFVVSELGAIVNIGTVGVGIFTAIGITSLGLFLGTIMANKLGISGPAAITMMVAGGMGGLGIAMLKIGGGSFWNFIGWGLTIVAIAEFIFQWITGWGKMESRRVEFTCQAWQAPTGKADCAKCNEDLLRPCTKYRCESIGQVCKLLNEYEENSLCESIPYEPNPPIITYGEIITDNYDFINSETKTIEIIPSTGETCIPEFTSVSFTLKTDEAAQCKYSFEIPGPTY